MAAALNKERN